MGIIYPRITKSKLLSSRPLSSAKFLLEKFKNTKKIDKRFNFSNRTFPDDSGILQEIREIQMTGLPGAFNKVELSAFEKKISCFVVFHFYQMLSNVSFISMAIKKVFLTVQIATISNLSKTSTL